MPIYEKGWFHMSGISFQIPDGFYLDLITSETNDEIVLFSPNIEYCIHLRLEEGCQDAKTEFKKMWKYVQPHEEAKAICINGITGYQAIFTCLRWDCYEIRLDLEDSNFVIDVSTMEFDLEPAVKHPGIQATIHSVRRNNIPKL